MAIYEAEVQQYSNGLFGSSDMGYHFETQEEAQAEIDRINQLEFAIGKKLFDSSEFEIVWLLETQVGSKQSCLVRRDTDGYRYTSYVQYCFSLEGDTEFIEELIKKRNRFVEERKVLGTKINELASIIRKRLTGNRC